MVWVVRIAPFAALLVLGVSVVLARGGRHQRSTTSAFIALFVVSSCLAGLTQHDFWPFSAYPIIPESARAWNQATWYEARAVDEHGEHPVNASPLAPSVLEKWLERRFLMLAPAEKNEVARFLLARSADSSCANERILGALAAPDFLLHTGGTPSGHTRVFRVYRNAIGQRVLIYEYRMQ